MSDDFFPPILYLVGACYLHVLCQGRPVTHSSTFMHGPRSQAPLDESIPMSPRCGDLSSPAESMKIDEENIWIQQLYGISRLRK